MADKMSKRDAEEAFKEAYLPRLPPDDKPARRMAWNNYVDSLQRDGRITEHQASTWGHPAFIA